MARAGPAGEPGDDRGGTRPPPRRTEAGERREHPHPGAVLHLGGERGEGRRVRREPEVAAQPFEQRARGEHPAVEGVLHPPVHTPRDRRQQPALRRIGALGSRVREHEHPGAVGGLHPTGHHAAGTRQRGLLVHHLGAQRQLTVPVGVAEHAEVSDAVADVGQGVARALRTGRAAADPSRARPVPRAGCATPWRDRWRSPDPSMSQSHESTVPSRSVPASSARCTAGSCSSSQVSLPAEKYGSSGMPLRSRTSASEPSASRRSSTSWERLSCQVTIGVSGSPLSASQASTDSPWWSSPHATTSPSAVGEQLAHGVHHRHHHVLGVLLHPARPRMRERLLPAGLGLLRQVGVVEHRLDGRGALVDAEQQRPAHAAARYSAVRRHHSPARVGARRRGSGARHRAAPRGPTRARPRARPRPATR